MAKRHRESVERKRYLTAIKREKPRDGKVVFLFDPPLSVEQMKVVSESTNDFIDANLKPKGGGFISDEKEKNETFTGIAVPQFADKEVVLALFRLLERDGICDKYFPKEPNAELLKPTHEVTQKQSETRKKVEAATASADVEDESPSRAAEVEDLAKKVKEGVEKLKNADKEKAEKEKQALIKKHEKELKEAEERQRAEAAEREKQLHQTYAEKLLEAAEREAELNAAVINSVPVPQPTTPREVAIARSMLRVFMEDRQEPDLDVLRTVLSQEEPLIIGNNEVLVLPEGLRIAIMCEIITEPGGVLYIKPGSDLAFDKEGGIINRGLIKAVGKVNGPIVFRNLNQNEKWKNISIEGDDENLLQYCIIEGGSGRIYTLDPEKKLAFIDESGRNPQKRTESGGGLALLNGCSNTVMRGVVVRNCVVKGHGGGIWNYHASPKCTEIHCIDNKAVFGGGIYINGGQPEFKGTSFQGNEADLNGGGLMVSSGSPEFIGSEFQKNSAKNGAGFYLNTNQNSFPNLQETLLVDNFAKDLGGGGYLNLDYNQTTGEAYHPVIDGGAIMRNEAKQGGGFYIYHNIPKRSYDFMHHEFHPQNMAAAGNTPDDLREVFRSR